MVVLNQQLIKKGVTIGVAAGLGRCGSWSRWVWQLVKVGVVVLQWLGGWYCSGWVGGTAVVGWAVLQWLGGRYCSGWVGGTAVVG